METDAIVTNPEKAFKRFLYTGQESSKYTAGCNKLDRTENYSFFTNVAKDLVSACQAVKVFEEAKKNSSFSSHIIFALAATVQKLSKEDKDYEIRELFYQIVPNILTSSEELMLFVKYADELGLKKGTRWQNCIKNWYKKCSFDILSNDIALMKHRHGWTHHDIIRLTHLSPYSTEQSLTLKYLWLGVNGLSEVKDVPENVIINIKNADLLKRCHDFTEASNLIPKIENLKISLLPAHLLRSQKDNSEVWKALIERISPSEILLNMEYLQLAGMLEDLHSKTEKISRPQLTAYFITAVSRITAPPILAYITYCNYKNNQRFLRIKDKLLRNKRPKNKELENTTTNNDCSKSYISKNKKLRSRCDRRCNPSPDLSLSLKSLVDRSLKSVEKAVNITCMITIDMRDHMFYSSIQPKNDRSNDNSQECDIEGNDVNAEISQPKVEVKNIKQKAAKCYYSRNVVPGHAGILLALYVSKLMKHTYVAVYTNDGVSIVKLFKNSKNSKEILSMEEAEVVLKNVKQGKVGFQKPFNWAIANKTCVDLFINVVDTTAHIAESSMMKKNPDKNLYSLLKNYREVMNVPETRAITISLSSHKAVTTNSSEEGIFDIAGFDATVPEIIKNFALREFD